MNKFEVFENNAAEEANIKEYYEKIVELSAQLIEKHGYKRSGKSGIFYKYNLDKSNGYLIGFRKSLDNTPDCCLFYILFGNVGINELDNIGTSCNNVNLQTLKSMLMNGYSASNYSHKLDDFVVKSENACDYFQFNILPELKSIVNALSKT